MGTYQGDDTTGFQSPAQDYIEPVINLADILDLRRPGLSKLNRPETGGDVRF